MADQIYRQRMQLTAVIEVEYKDKVDLSDMLIDQFVGICWKLNMQFLFYFLRY